MSRTTIALVLIVYFVAALAFGVFIEVQKQSPFLPEVTIGRTIGTATSLYVMSGIMPLILWAFDRFNSKAAKGPLILWAFLGIAVAYFMHLGYSTPN